MEKWIEVNKRDFFKNLCSIITEHNKNNIEFNIIFGDDMPLHIIVVSPLDTVEFAIVHDKFYVAEG